MTRALPILVAAIEFVMLAAFAITAFLIARSVRDLYPDEALEERQGGAIDAHDRARGGAR